MSEYCETVIIGAGVVGLACARDLAQHGHEVLVLEKETTIGNGISSRNSEVIHAGLYYPPGSRKAALCVRGKALLYAYAKQRHITHRRLGKFVVATTPEEQPALEQIGIRAQANGVGDLIWLDRNDCRRREPALAAEAALFSPSTGIIDSHGLMLSLLGEAQDRGAMIAYGSRVNRITPDGPGFVLQVHQEDGTSFPLACRHLVNAAGLGAVPLLRRIDGFPAARIPPLYFAKGNYFTYRGRVPFRHLIYPVPVPGGLGIHLTLDLAGQGKFGPDVEWVKREDYDVTENRRPQFAAAVRRYWPAVEEERLIPNYAGIRPKIVPPDQGDQDFQIQTAAQHGFQGLVNLLGIDSPGLTAALAIAEQVGTALDNQEG